MAKLRELVALMTFTLGLLAPAGLPGAQAADNDPPQAPRVDRPDTTHRAEDPLQAPRGETR
ncbi:MAG TPA: hypothetical protein VIA61_19665 [Methylomirabilota bacterium]